MPGCIFCGQTPVTSTHIFRRAWFERIAPTGQPFTHRHEREGDDAFDRSWEGREFMIAPNCACNACNSGWMDRLDHAAEALIEPCVLGHPRRLARIADHAIVATWATLVGLLFSQTQVSPPFSEARYREFGADPRPFGGTRVWLAATVKPPEVALRVNGFPRGGTTVDGMQMYFATFRINHLVVQTFIPPEPLNEELSFGRGSNVGFVRTLWPSPLTPVSWPPDRIVREEDLMDFAEGFLDLPAR